MKSKILLILFFCLGVTNISNAQKLLFVDRASIEEVAQQYGVANDQIRIYEHSKKKMFILLPIAKNADAEVVRIMYDCFLRTQAKKYNVDTYTLLSANPYLETRSGNIITKGDYLYIPTIYNASNTQSSNCITLIETGIAATKDEATKQALRSALEQAYGTFVSSNTSIVNDEITKDEIVSISQGNIQSYKELSCNKIGNEYHVTVQAVVSIGKLISYAQSKGASAELAGATFAMNVKIEKLNKENEKKAIDNLVKELLLFEQTNNFYDYSIELYQPEECREDDWAVPIGITCTPNANFDVYVNMIRNGLSAIGYHHPYSGNTLPSEECSYHDSKLRYRHSTTTGDYTKAFDGWYCLRNDYGYLIKQMYYLGCVNVFKNIITDNLGNRIYSYAVDSNKQYPLEVCSIPSIGYLEFKTAGADNYNYLKKEFHRDPYKIEKRDLPYIYEKKSQKYLLIKRYSLEELAKLQKMDIAPIKEMQIYDVKDGKYIKSNKGAL